MEPIFPLAGRNAHPGDTVIEIGHTKLGGGHFQLIGGPCTVESEEQVTALAAEVKAAGGTMLRGGAFKPRTSPYSFQGLGPEGLRLLIRAGRAAGLPVVSEIMDVSQLEYFAEVDMIQVGARSMQNFALLKELGRSDKPVLLKRGAGNNLEELLFAAEYIMAGGNTRIALCERGIRSFESYSRFTLDISAVPILQALSHLPVIVDPSHAASVSCYVGALSRAAVAAGCDGLLIEIHNDPNHALCDGAQALTGAEFAALAEDVRALRPIAQAAKQREGGCESI